MPTLTLELPEDLANALNRLPDTERNNYAIAWLRAGVQEELLNVALSEQDLAAVAAGIADGEVGREESFEDFVAEMSARRAARRAA